MRVNFEIKDNYAIAFQGRHIDLHNNFDLESFHYNVVNKEFELNWKKAEGDWVSGNELETISITHKNVNFLRIIEADSEMPDSEGNCLMDLTYYPAISREENDSIVFQSVPKDNDDIIYTFQNGQVIRINCEEIELKITEK